MRIIVISDSHGDIYAVNEIFKRNEDVKTFIFLGDGYTNINQMKLFYPDKEILCVSGNCDFTCDEPLVKTYETPNGTKIVFTHGHKYAVGYTNDGLINLAKENSAKIVLFGHTHSRFSSYKDGIYIFNPGSCSSPRDFKPACYGFIDITNNGIMTSHVELGNKRSRIIK